jgi:hypothetical protein
MTCTLSRRRKNDDRAATQTNRASNYPEDRRQETGDPGRDPQGSRKGKGGEMKFPWWPNTKDHGKEYSRAEIIEQSAPYIHNTNYCGVYFLLDCEEIVYVGKSVDVRNRLKQHSDNLNKVWNRYFFIRCDREELDRLEAYYILRFRPKYNIAIPKVNDEKKDSSN